ncbi:kynureninase [Rheinheimera sp. UJ51]|uniref:kynureninase n=1 Tax=Rheinheimera sp. UJ51 TaxID=2892446 RepID=UPI001E5C5761|nr:kynureninase [Rheinheimera sp. UJ51]MCC5451758.1 kynureninase [Rheinheimera sp. UJ51]
MNYQELLQLDQKDPLHKLREAFVLPDDTIYLDGNSLGPMPKVCAERAQEVLHQQWSQDLIKSWNTHQWIELPSKVGSKIAALIGAAPEQVICCDSTSINLFKVLSSALLLQPKRRIVLSFNGNFPTDLYMVQGLSSLIGEDRCEMQLVEEAELEQALTEQIAVLLLSHVDFRSGKLLDMARITKLAQQQGILVIWDLAHSAGALPVALDVCQVDFAVGCGYKYLNGGPGAPAFLYVAKRHLSKVSQPLSGWMGHKAPFAFTIQYEKPAGIEHFLTGTPPVISMSVLDAALDVFADVNMQTVRAKSLALANTFHQLLTSHAELHDLTLLTPLAEAERGSQLAYRHPQAYALCQALIKRGVIADFRAPDILRLGFTPLYLRYIDMWIAIEIFSDVVKTAEYLKAEYAVKQKVT